jgi:hypothetical protein
VVAEANIKVVRAAVETGGGRRQKCHMIKLNSFFITSYILDAELSTVSFI